MKYLDAELRDLSTASLPRVRISATFARTGSMDEAIICW